MSAARTERLLNLLTLLLNTRRPLSLRELRELPEFAAYQSTDPKSGERAFERDKAALVELGVPLQWVAPERDDDEDGAGGYLIDRARYYLTDLELKPAELALLSIAGAAAASLPGLPHRDVVMRALAKLGFDTDEDAVRTQSMAHAPISPGVDPVRLGENLAVLHDAVATHTRVRFIYTNLKQEEHERDVSPYGLYYRQGVWYLVGHCHFRDAERTFHLGRMRDATKVGPARAFGVPDSFDLSSHVQRRPWEFPNGPAVRVSLRLAKRLGPALRELFGPHATVSEDARGTLVHLDVTHRAAFIATVLPLGAAALVVSPKDLRQEIAQTYVALAATYGAS